MYINKCYQQARPAAVRGQKLSLYTTTVLLTAGTKRYVHV